MKRLHLYFIALFFLLILPTVFNDVSYATVIQLDSLTSGSDKINAGYYNDGTILDISATGTISLIPLIPGTSFWTNPDGSVVGKVAGYGYEYANAGQPYPNTYGGDGINHFVGGGMNYDGYNFGFAGVESTDTTNPNTIRFGAIVGTFVETDPSRNDWFFIGNHQILPVPDGGATLYLAVLDTLNSNNVGYYTVNLAPVPEPATTWLFGAGLICLIGIRRKLKR